MSISSSQPSVEKRLTLSKNPFIATAVEFPPNVELIFESEAQTQDEMLQANQKYKEEESKRLVEMSKRKEEEETFSRIQEEALSRKKEDEEKEQPSMRTNAHSTLRGGHDGGRPEQREGGGQRKGDYRQV